MNIQLSQKEIETAVRQYLLCQGFSLSNRTFTVKFTSTRNPAGVSADITLEDIPVKGVDTTPLSVVQEVMSVTEATKLETSEADVYVVPEVVEAVVDTTPEVVEEPKTVPEEVAEELDATPAVEATPVAETVAEAVPAASVENLFAAPAEVKQEAAPIQTTSLFG